MFTKSKNELPQIEGKLNLVANLFREQIDKVRVTPIQNKDRTRNKYDNLQEQVNASRKKLKLAKFIDGQLTRNVEQNTAILEELKQQIHELQTDIIEAPTLPYEFPATSSSWLIPSERLTRSKVLREEHFNENSSEIEIIKFNKNILASTGVKTFLNAAQRKYERDLIL
jgi:hypothetical protein